MTGVPHGHPRTRSTPNLPSTEPARDVLGALDRAALRVAAACSDSTMLKRITATLRRDGMEVVALAPVIDELVLECADIDVDVAVWAIDEIRHAEQGLRLVSRRLPGVCLVVVARELNGPDLGRALALRASGLVRQRDVLVALPATVAAVSVGQIVVPRDLRPTAAREPLTPREQAVFELVQEGLTNREIAARLYLAESTVKTYVSEILWKLGVRSRREVRSLSLEGSRGHQMS